MNYSFLVKDGGSLIEKKQYKTAEDIFKKVISYLEKEKDKKNLQILCEAYNNLGYIFYRRVEFNKALEYYNESIRLNESYGIAYYNRGTIHYRMGSYEPALRDMEKAVIFEPDKEEFRVGLEACKYALALKAYSG